MGVMVLDSELVQILQGAGLPQPSSHESSRYTEDMAGLQCKVKFQTNGEGGIFYHEDEFLRGDGAQDSAKMERIFCEEICP